MSEEPKPPCQPTTFASIMRKNPEPMKMLPELQVAFEALETIITPEQRVARAYGTWFSEAIWDGQKIADIARLHELLAEEIRRAVAQALKERQP